jgi:murein DD-endopeptidase MepM/ murein hydrolase activator NlpD
MLILAAASGVMAILLLAQVSTPDAAPSAAISSAADGGDEAGDAAPLDAGQAGLDAAPEEPPPPPQWRVTSLQAEPGVELVEGAMAKQKTLLGALGALGVSKGEGLRLAHAFDGVRSFDDASPKDTFVVAREKSTGKIVAFEYATSPFDVWQARHDEEKNDLVARRLPLHVAKKRVAVGVAVAGDLRESIVGAGLDDDLMPLLDDALEGHAELADLRPGARLRVLAVEDRVDGKFAGYQAVEAVEYTPAPSPRPDAPEPKALRVYFFNKAPESSWVAHSRKDDDAKSTKVPRSYFYDAHGRQPMHGGWKSPVPFARIASRFNPKRMHPVLHVVRPHNGVDFAAPPGTPIYAAGDGTVKMVGNGGACGNEVQVSHANGFTTAYCHMSRFASGLRVGQHVDAHQLVGYVGSTGRTTGPHLHFAVKRGEMFIDPLALKLDGVRVVPLADRAEFERVRAELDIALDGVSLPPPVAVDGDAGAAPESTYDAGSDDFDESN